MIIEIFVPIIASAVFFLLGQYFQKRRSKRQIKKERVDRVNAELIKVLEEKCQTLETISWTSHLSPSEIQEVKRNNLAYISEEERKKIESLIESLRKTSDLAKNVEEEIGELVFQELKERWQSEKGIVNEPEGPRGGG